MNLRVTAAGEIALSVPPGVTVAQADAFVADRAGWITRALATRDAARAREAAEPVLSREECLARMTRATLRMLPLVARYVPALPVIEVRNMKTRWGVCHTTQGRIVYSTRTAAQPPELQDYVALHELVHFAYPNHGPAFHGEMARLMPDYLRRRQLLRQGPPQANHAPGHSPEQERDEVV